MTAIVRFPRDMVKAVQADLRRPHRFAWERVGFLFGPCRPCGSRTLILPTEYLPVPDDEYLTDPWVGARIGREPIRRAMQRVLVGDLCCLHIHVHDHAGPPWFSDVDLKTTEELSRPLTVVASRCVHGAVVLSDDSASVLTWSAATGRLTTGRVTFVGVPMGLLPAGKPTFSR